MQVFKTFFKISRKYRGSFFVYLFVFSVLLNIFIANKADNSTNSFKASSIKMSIFDHDDSQLSRALISYLDDKHTLVSITENIDDIRDNMYTRSVEYVLIIPEGFESDVIQNKDDYPLEAYKIPGSIAGIFADSQINKFISIYSSYILAGFDSDAATKETTLTLSNETEIALAESESEEDPEVHFYYSYLTYILLSVITLCISPIIIVFNKADIKSRTSISCVSPLKSNLSLSLAALLYTLLIFALFTVIAIVMYPEDMLTQIGAIRILNSFVHILVCLGFAFCLSTFLTNDVLLGFITNSVGLAGGFLCGIFIDRELLSKTVLTIGKIFPAYWYIDVENELLKYDSLSGLTQTSSSILMFGFLIQILFAIVLFVSGMVISKSRKSIA